jgi:putative serine protease PepD
MSNATPTPPSDPRGAWWSQPEQPAATAPVAGGAATQPVPAYSDPWATAGPAGPPPPPPPTRGGARRPGWFALAIATAASGVVGGLVGTQLADSDDTASTSTREQPVTQTQVPARAPESVAGIAQQALPSVVSIATAGGTGSGFIISEDGYIVTNNHVVADAGPQGVRVSLRDGREVEATVVGTSPAYDLAVLDVELDGLTPLPIGDSDQVVVGDPVVAVGNPLGLEGTVTAGIVSAVNRPVTAGGQDEVSFINAIQTDAAINPGNSGGPLLDAAGNVVGVNSSIATLGGGGGLGQGGSIGLGFAIPIKQAQLTADEIIAGGEATFPVIGATLDVSSGAGAVIASLVPGGPAEGAGLRPGDVVTQIDGTTVRTAEELIVAIRSRQPGDTVELSFDRNGTEDTVTLTLDSSVG